MGKRKGEKKGKMRGPRYINGGLMKQASRPRPPKR